MNRRGFTLFELFIALSLAVLIVFELGALQLSSQRTSEELEVEAELLDEVNTALSHMENRIKKALGMRRAGTFLFPHYGLDVSDTSVGPKTAVSFTLDESRDAFYDLGGEISHNYRIWDLSSVGGGSSELWYDYLDTSRRKKLIDNVVLPGAGDPPVFKIVDDDLAHNQLEVNITASREINGRTYTVTVSDVITAREMCH
jgi:hypothetical protein